jgi:hypothetical protein
MLQVARNLLDVENGLLGPSSLLPQQRGMRRRDRVSVHYGGGAHTLSVVARSRCGGSADPDPWGDALGSNTSTHRLSGTNSAIEFPNTTRGDLIMLKPRL